MRNKKKDLLTQAVTFTTSDLIAVTNPPPCFAEKYFNRIKLKLPSFLSPTAPPSIDYHQADDPCLFLHGNDCKTKIKSTSTFAPACSARDLVMCARTETKKVLANALCSSDFFFCHDPLTQMSNAVTTRCMKEQDTRK